MRVEILAWKAGIKEKMAGCADTAFSDTYFFLPAFAANTQVLQQLPSLFDAGVVSKRVQGSLHRSPAATALVTQKTEQTNPQIEAEKKIHFKLKKVTLLGNTVFSAAEITQIYHDKINKIISIYDLQLLADDITKK